MTAWEVRAHDEVRVTCPIHGMDKIVTATHAANLVNYHNRNDHPGGNWLQVSVADILAGPSDPEPGYNISAAAKVVHSIHEQWALYQITDGQRAGARAVWEALTGLTGDDAMTKATEVAAGPTIVLAHQPPF